MEEKDFYTLEEIEDEFVGKKSTPRRNKYEADLNSFYISDTIRQAREAKDLTEEELGKLLGI